MKTPVESTIMKKFILLLALAVTFIACEGDQGPPGVTIVGQSFEREVDFRPENDYAAFIPFPNGIEAFETDRVLVYRLEFVDDAVDGGTVDVWSLLPQLKYTIDGESFQYNFVSSGGDVEIFMDSPDRALLDVIDFDFVEDQIFRIVILPVDLIQGVDLMDYEAVMKAGQVQQIDVQM